MRLPLRVSRATTLVAAILCVVSASADDKFDQGKKLFADHNYVDSCEILGKVDRDTLSKEQQAELDHLLETLPQAIQAAERSAQDMSAAEQAYEDGRWSDADHAYAAVIANPFSSQTFKERAATRRESISEKLALADAAKPAGPVEAKPEPAKPAARQAADQEEQAAPAPVEQPRTITILEEIRQRDSLLWQRAVAKMNEAARRSREAADAARFDEARELAETALQMIEANRGYAQPASQYQAARAQAIELKREIADRRDKYAQMTADERRREIEQQLTLSRERISRQRQEKVEQLLSTARQLQKEQRYAEAAEAMRQALMVEPSNTLAKRLKEVYEDDASLHEQQKVNHIQREQWQDLMLETERTKIPWHHDILYPQNWPEIVARRDGFEAFGNDENLGLNRTLDEIQPELDFQDIAFDKVVEKLRDQGDINIAVDWDDLGANGIERDKPISFRARDVRMRTAIQEILRQAGGDVSLGFIVAEGLLRVATKSKLDRDKSVLVYDIRDLIVSIPRFTSAPRVDVTQLPSAPPIAGFAGSSNPMFGDFASENDDQVDQRIRKSDKDMLHQITDIIRTTVEPDSWRETGGGDGALRELNGQLIVYNTSSAQQQVQDLLSQLRESRALMIAVEARFLIVTSNFLEEIGVDLDFVFNAGTAGFDPAFNNQQQALIDPFTGSRVLIPRRVSRAGVIPAVPGLGGGALGAVTPASPFLNPALIPAAGSAIPRSGFSTPFPVAQNSIGLANPGNVNTGIPGTLSQSVAEARNAGINFAGSYLDNLQVDFLIRATQASRRSSIVQAPRLMLFNGQRAWVAVVRSRQYVSTVTANVAEGAVGVQPLIAVAQSGTSLDIQGTISADRKYVTITVRTGIAQEPNFEDFQVQRASGNSPGIFVRLVDQETRGLRTTVSVPDGGTVLLGGLKQVGEVELEAGVPILSKIPVLKRAFTNTTTVKDTQTLLILLKTKILIQSEAEEEAFPRLGSAG